MTGEQVALQLIAMGDLSITENGYIYRHARRRGNKRIVYDEPARIDYETSIGYFCFKCGIRGDKRRTVLVHRAVWVQAHGAIPDGLEVNHKDKIKSNNRLANLELMTHKDNILYSQGEANASCGMKHYFAKLTDDDVREIRRLASERTMKRKEIAAKYNLAPEYLWKIITRRSWKHIA